MNKYHNALKPLRKKAGFSQRQLAEKLGITQQAYSNYESGKRDIGTDSIRVLAKLFGCTTDEILGLEVSYEFVDISDLTPTARERVIGLIELERRTN